MSTAVIIGGGEFPKKPYPRELIRGADIIVMADAKAAEGGYSVNGGEYVRQGKVSFRLTVTENTEIKTIFFI